MHQVCCSERHFELAGLRAVVGADDLRSHHNANHHEDGWDPVPVRGPKENGVAEVGPRAPLALVPHLVPEHVVPCSTLRCVGVRCKLGEEVFCGQLVLREHADLLAGTLRYKLCNEFINLLRQSYEFVSVGKVASTEAELPPKQNARKQNARGLVFGNCGENSHLEDKEERHRVEEEIGVSLRSDEEEQPVPPQNEADEDLWKYYKGIHQPTSSPIDTVAVTFIVVKQP
jgi:hypothetical protein